MKFVLFGFSRMFCRKGLHSFYMLEEHERWRGKKIGRNISLLFSREAKFFFNSEGEEFESRQYIQRWWDVEKYTNMLPSVVNAKRVESAREENWKEKEKKTNLV